MVRSIAIATLTAITVTIGIAEAKASQAGQSSKPVTNADVISMVAARLSDDVIIGAVQQAGTTAFDLSPEGLIALQNAGVPDRILQAMLARAKSDGTGSPSASQPSPETRPKEPCRIFITEDDPPSRSYVVVRKEVQVGKKFYGSHDDNLMRELAKQADKVGADAIIRFHEWRAPSMWSWAAAKAGGMAVRWTDEGKAAVPALKGQCWTPKGRDDR